MDLKTRFSIKLSVVISIFLAVFCLGLYALFKQRVLHSAEQKLEEYLEHEWRHLTLRQNHASDAETLPTKEIAHRLTRNGAVVQDSLPKGIIAPPEGQDIAYEGAYLVRRLSRSWEGASYEVVGTYHLSEVFSFLAALRNALLLGGLFSVLLSIPLSIRLTASLLRPFRDLSAKTAELDAQKLSFRFPQPKVYDEYGILVRNINALLNRLEKSFGLMRRFATNASHELRTPVTIIRGEGEILLRKPRDAGEYQRGVQVMVTQAENLQRIIRRLLFLSDLERMEQEPRNTEVAVSQVVIDTATTLQTILGASEKKLEFVVPDGITYLGHPEIFMSVVTNLVENALKYSKSRVAVSVARQPEAVVLQVEDDGPGIPVTHREEVFETFTQGVHPDLERLPSKGHGLGLSIVKACLDAIDGKITLNASELGGLCARVQFPQALGRTPDV